MPSSPDTDDQIIGEFLEELARASDPEAVLVDFCRRYPHLATDFRDLARMEHIVGGTSVRPEDPYPQNLPDFCIKRKIAEGGMGIVYEAEQESLRRRVAVKVRRMRLSPEAQRRFRREQCILARLHQTHIVPIHTAAHADPWHYFAMAYIDGAALQHVIRAAWQRETSRPNGNTPTLAELAGEVARQSATAQRVSSADAKTVPTSTSEPAQYRTKSPSGKAAPPGRMTLSMNYFRSVAELMAEAAEALHHAHGVGIHHRDMKPSNIMVDTSGQCWIIDFGLAGYARDSAAASGPKLDDPGSEPADISGA